MNAVRQEVGLKYCRTCRREFDGRVSLCPSDGTSLLPVPSDLLATGQLVDDRYEIIERIGTGGMGTILLAYDLERRMEVALKVLKSELGQDRAAVTQFYQEARAAGRLRHENVVRIEGFGRSSDGHLYIAMELLGGFPLSQLLSERRPLPAPFAVECARQIACALLAAERAKTVHRDLKPENVQIIPVLPEERVNGAAPFQCKVLDFGIASVFRSSAKERANGTEREERVSGTPAYMSPEQILGQPVDARSDLYSLGVLLFEMLSGAPPFSGAEPVEVCRKHLTESAPRLRDRFREEDIPAALDTLVVHLLKKRPKHRPQRVQSALRRLEAIAETLPEPPAVTVDGRILSARPVPLPEPIRPFVPADPPKRAVEIEVGQPAPPAASSPALRPLPLAPPLIRDLGGALRVMPLAGGCPGGPALPERLPCDSVNTLPDLAAPLSELVESLTLKRALWVCPSCSFLNGGDDVKRCENCGAALSGPRTGVPVADLTDEDQEWRVFGDPRAEVRVARDPVRVAVPQAPAATPAKPLPPINGEHKRREVLLLHALLEAKDARDRALAGDPLNAVFSPIVETWLASLPALGGVLCQRVPGVLRVLFGADEVSVSPRWLVVVADAVLRLREAVAAADGRGGTQMTFRAAMALAHVSLPVDLPPDPDAVVRGSPVDIAIRLARAAAPGELQANARLWRRISARFSGRACDTIHARGARQPELVYRLDSSRSALGTVRPAAFAAISGI